VLAGSKACLVVPGKAGVIALLLKSGIALSHHDVSKKDLDLGLSVKGGVIALLLKSGIALSHHDVSKKDLDLGLSVH